ncbi:HTH domain-containing protein [Actinocorallia herbida]|uniref:HTH domain-containing protein n=1 Tax=Actinocorallia herbida TaxID=58109 RepID=A0A3N1CZI1_9ACTN|nr:transcriptional regulator [Actinocorallia herbida]ROO86662.1 HTH domain-containing protein [Actinocorallia herbida]
MTGTPSRMLTLLSLLQTRRDWPGRVLAERLDVSVRTVRRDVDRLRELGYRISAAKGPDGGYRLDAGAALPPLLFDDEQAIALAVALRTASAVGGTEIGEAAARALATVRQVLPARLRHRVDGVAVTALPGGPAPDPGVLVEVSAAVTAREELRFDHIPVGRAPDGAAVPRRVEPHHVVASGGRWYLVAWDLDRADWRLFRLDRMTPRTPTGPRFAPRQVPGDDLATFLSARFKGSGTADAWACTGEVVLSLPAHEVLPYVGDGLVEAVGPDRCRLITGSWSWVALAASLGRFDAPLTVVSPPELTAAFALLAARYGAAAEDPHANSAGR